MKIKVNVDEYDFKGVVEVEMPRFSEKIALLKAMTYEGNEISQTDQALEMAKIAEQRIVSVDLKHEKSGEHFDNLEKLELYAEGSNVIYKIAGIILNGLPLGNG